jgi:hypothetical protein
LPFVTLVSYLVPEKILVHHHVKKRVCSTVKDYFNFPRKHVVSEHTVLKRDSEGVWYNISETLGITSGARVSDVHRTSTCTHLRRDHVTFPGFVISSQ